MPAPTLRQLTVCSSVSVTPPLAADSPPSRPYNASSSSNSAGSHPKTMRWRSLSRDHAWHQRDRVLRRGRRSHHGFARSTGRSSRGNRAIGRAGGSHDPGLRNLAHQRVGDGRHRRDHRRRRRHDVVQHLYLVRPYFKSHVSAVRALVITMSAFAAVWKLDLGPLPVIGIAVVVGLLWKEPA